MFGTTHACTMSHAPVSAATAATTAGPTATGTGTCDAFMCVTLPIHTRDITHLRF